MKRLLFFAAAFILIAWAASSCSDLGDCQFCRIVTRSGSGTLIDAGTEAEYCGDDIDAYKAANPDVTDPVTGNKTKVECR